MGVYLGNINLLGGGAAASALPETVIFTQSGTWTVPDSIKNEIASEGHAEVGLLMVGGGSITTTAGDVATRSGEVRQELYQLTTSDYDDPNAANPTISVTIGAVGGYSGITDVQDATHPGGTSLDNQGIISGLRATSTTSFNVTTTTQTQASQQFITKNASGKPAITRFASTTFTSNVVAQSGVGLPPSGLILSVSGGTITSTSGSLGTFVRTWDSSDPGYFNSVTAEWSQVGSDRFFLTGTWNGSGITWSGSIPSNTFREQLYNSQSGGRILYYGAQLNYNLDSGIVSATQARAGSDADYDEFTSNPYSPEGVLGYARNYDILPGTSTYSALPSTPGSPGQGGYIQIFYS